MIRLASASTMLVFSSVIAAGCAQGTDTLGIGGGRTGGGGAGATGSGGGPTTGSSGGSTSSSGTSTSSNSSSSSSGTTTSSSTTSSSSGTMSCGAMEHFCNGVCEGNTPATGCFGSVSCAPCSPPANATSTCTAAGQCDFDCSSGYNKSGNACVCAQQCCGDADCAVGETCVGGVCQGAMACDANACQAQCFLSCFGQMKVGVGTCLNNVCTCVCL